MAADRLPALDYRCVRLGSGGHVLVVEAGERTAPAVVLIHGLGDNAHRDWKHVYGRMASQFHVMALDLPGFGASDAVAGGYSFQALDQAIDEVTTGLGVQRFHLVGHSLGAAVSLYFADRHPERIDRLVLVDAAGVLLKQVFARQLLESNRASGYGTFADLMGVFGQGRSDQLLDLIEDRLDVGAIMALPGVRDALLRAPIHADAAMGLVEHDFTGAIRNVATPTVVIWGEDDNITPLRTGHLLAARMRNARLDIVKGARHMPMTERPDAFNQVLLAALTSPVPVQRAPSTGKSQGDAECRDGGDVSFTGVFDRIVVSNCRDVRIEQASLQQLTVEGSSVILTDVSIASRGVALRASSATITGTALDIAGDIALRANDSRIDLAGATLRATSKAFDLTGSSRLYFSVSEIDAPDYRGGVHAVWGK